jgi:hypothetical protein
MKKPKSITSCIHSFDFRSMNETPEEVPNVEEFDDIASSEECTGLHFNMSA